MAALVQDLVSCNTAARQSQGDHHAHDDANAARTGGATAALGRLSIVGGRGGLHGGASHATIFQIAVTHTIQACCIIIPRAGGDALGGGIPMGRSRRHGLGHAIVAGHAPRHRWRCHHRRHDRRRGQRLRHIARGRLLGEIVHGHAPRGIVEAFPMHRAVSLGSERGIGIFIKSLGNQVKRGAQNGGSGR